MPGRSWRGHELKRCERCGEPLRPMEPCPCDEKRPLPVPVSERFLAVDGVEAKLGDRVLTGSLVIRDEGLFLFIERCEERPSLLVSIVNAAVDKVAGLAGGLFMKAVEGGVKEQATPPEGSREREDFRAFYDRALHEAPSILRSRWCLPIPRGVVRTASFRGDGLLELAMLGFDAELWANFGERGAAAFMQAAGYPVERLGPALGKKAALAAVAALALWATLRELSDLQQVEQWTRPKVAAAAEAAVGGKSTISIVLVRDGKRFYLVDNREVPEHEVPWRRRFWFHYREIVILLAVAGCFAGLGLWATVKKLG